MPTEIAAGLVLAGLATAETETVRAGGQPMKSSDTLSRTPVGIARMTDLEAQIVNELYSSWSG